KVSKHAKRLNLGLEHGVWGFRCRASCNTNSAGALPRLATCLQLAQREKSEWEQPHQEHPKRAGFRNINRSAWDSASADHYRAAATRCDRKAATQTVGATAG